MICPEHNASISRSKQFCTFHYYLQFTSKKYLLLQAITERVYNVERYASFIFLVMKNTECTESLSILRNPASYRYRHKQHVLSSVHNECLYNVLGQVHRIFILSNREPLKSWQTPYMHKLFATSKSHSNCNIRQIAEKALCCIFCKRYYF